MLTRLFIVFAGAALLLCGCSLFGDSNPRPANGLVVADEPDAAEAGAAVLAHGGNAADAVAATYFALSVTYPVAAGLGGGGICIVYDSSNEKAQSFEFLAREAAENGAYAIPGNVSGFSQLQSRYGVLPWQRVISPAESLAAAGFAISRALEARLASSNDILRLDATLASEFLDEAGQVKPAEAIARAPALAQTLSKVREFGPSAFYRGPIADDIVAYSQAQGGGITSGELASYAPRLVAPAGVSFGDQTVYLPSSQIGAGKFARALLQKLVRSDGSVSDEATPTTAVAAATKTVLDEFGISSLPRDLGATGFAAEDSSGLAVACGVTMNGPFGSGHTAATTGVTLATAPSAAQSGMAAAFLTPVIATGRGTIFLTGAGAGGPNGTAAIARALLKLSHGADIIEPGTLHSTGIAPYDTVNVIGCENGVCAALPDPGAFGLGAAG